MPIPLPPHHLLAKLEKELQGHSEERQIAILRRCLSEEIPSGARGHYRALRDSLQRRIQKLETLSTTRAASHQDPYHFPKQGDGRICVVGAANAGKSAVVSMLTAAPVEIGDYPFTTQTPTPGMLQYEGASIQILDTPAFVRGLAEGEGSGRRLLRLVCSGNAVAVVVDLSRDPAEQVELVWMELASARCRLRPRPAATAFRPKGKGGIKFAGYPVTKDEQAEAQAILAEREVAHGEIVIRERFSAEELSRQLDGETLLPALLIAHKCDVPESAEHRRRLSDAFPEFPIVETNFLDETGVSELKSGLLRLLGLARVFLLDRPDPDSERQTFYLPRGSAVQDAAEESGMQERPASFTARVWGRSVRRGGQVVGLGHLLEHGDALYLKG